MRWLYPILPTLASPAVAAGFLQAPVAPVVGPNWELIDNDGAAKTYIDPAGSSRHGDLARVRLVSINDEVNFQDVKSALTVVEIDCRAGSGVVIEEGRFRADGTQIDGGLVPPEERRTRVAAPGSREARLVARACGSR